MRRRKRLERADKQPGQDPRRGDAGFMEKLPRKPKKGEVRELVIEPTDTESTSGAADTAEFMKQQEADNAAALERAKENARRAAQRGGAAKKFTPESKRPDGPEDPDDTPPSGGGKKPKPYKRAPERKYSPSVDAPDTSNVVDLASERAARTGELEKVNLDPDRNIVMASSPGRERARERQEQEKVSANEILRARESDTAAWKAWTDHILDNYRGALRPDMSEEEVYGMITTNVGETLSDVNQRRYLAQEVMKRLPELGMEERDRAALEDEMRKMSERVSSLDAEMEQMKRGNNNPELLADRQQQRQQAADRIKAIRAQLDKGMKAA